MSGALILLHLMSAEAGLTQMTLTHVWQLGWNGQNSQDWLDTFLCSSSHRALCMIKLPNYLTIPELSDSLYSSWQVPRYLSRSLKASHDLFLFPNITSAAFFLKSHCGQPIFKGRELESSQCRDQQIILGHFQLTTLLILLRVLTFQGCLMPCTTCLLLLFQSHILLIFPLLSSYLFLKCMLLSYEGLSHFSFLLMAISSACSSCPQITVELTACFIQVSTNMLSSLQRSSLTTFVTPFPNS